jgi:hypothetical protein
MALHDVTLGFLADPMHGILRQLPFDDAAGVRPDRVNPPIAHVIATYRALDLLAICVKM